MAVRMYERKHEHDGGSIVARVVERDNARYDVIVKVYALDGSELTLAAGSVITEGQFETLAEAQRAADREAAGFALAVGHECSAGCNPWPKAVTH